MARNATWPVQPVLAVTLALLFASCATPEIIRETPQPGATATLPIVPVGTDFVPTGTASTSSPRRQIERITLATEIDANGAPQDERSVIPEAAERFYLCVQVRHVEQGTRFRAIWFASGEIIGQSDTLALENADAPVWIALSYRPIGGLNPAQEHAVELVVDDETAERLVFRVGVGDVEDAVAAAAFTTGFDALGKPINPQTRFHTDTPQLTLRVRISNQVDPSAMIFSTLWYRGDTQIRQQPPDPPQTPAQGTPTSDARRVDFTFVPSSRLTPGDYRVALLLNGTEVRSVPFVITEEALPTPTPVPTETPVPPPTVTPEPSPTPIPVPPTATSAPSDAEVVDIVVASRIDFDSQAPADGPLFEWDAAPDSVVVLWVSVSVLDVRATDTLEIAVVQNETFYGSVTLTETDLSTGWLAGRVELVAPSAGNAPITYSFNARVNGVRTLSTSLQLSAVD